MGFILGTILGSFVLIFISSAYLFFVFKKKSLKKLIKKLGSKTEEQVNADLKIWARHTGNKFIGSSVFHYDENKVFETDSILITQEAIIVVEIKSINGGIKGDANEDNWVKILGDKNFSITNAIKQNEKHIQHIVKMIDLKVPIVSLIIYSNKTKFIDIKNIPSHALVIRHADAFETLDKLTISLTPKLSEDNIKTINSKIKSFIAKKEGLNLHKKITSFGGGKI